MDVQSVIDFFFLVYLDDFLLLAIYSFINTDILKHKLGNWLKNIGLALETFRKME